MVKLYNGDCLEFMRTLPDKSVDAVVTDPPYGIKKAEWDNVFPVDWIDFAWQITHKMLVMSGTSSIIEAAVAVGQYKDCIIMHARNGMTKSKVAFGNWFPVLVCGEWKWEARPNYLPFNVVVTEKINHPSPKPLSAMLKLIDKYTKPGEVVFDPFMGSGTTGVACVQLGRNFIGCELDPRYFAIAEKRIKEAEAQPPLFQPVVYPDSYQGKLFDGIESATEQAFAPDPTGRGQART